MMNQSNLASILGNTFEQFDGLSSSMKRRNTATTLVSALTADTRKRALQVVESKNIDTVSMTPASYMKSFAPATKKRKLSIAISSKDQCVGCYDMESVGLIRSNDVAALRRLYQEGKSFDACNSNGETLIHLACRRASFETVQFLVCEANVNVDVIDNMGRTVLHDVCWRPQPETNMLKLLMDQVSDDHIFAEDIRGHSCFDYCRKIHQREWMPFLQKQFGSSKNNL